MKNLVKQQEKMNREQDAMTELIQNRWPENSTVECYLHKKQFHPRRGTVITHRLDYVRVRFDTPGKLVKNIHFSRII